MSRKKSSPYSGVLATPIVRQMTLGLLHLGDRRYEDELIEKIPALFAHYGILRTDRLDWQRLAIALAFDHVEGFRIVDPPKRRGPRLRWTLEGCKALVAAIEAEQRAGRPTIGAAIRAAQQKPSWRWKSSTDSIKTRYSEAKKRIAEDKAQRKRFAEMLGKLPVVGLDTDPKAGPLFGPLDAAPAEERPLTNTDVNQGPSTK